MPTAAIITIGNELLSGDVADTNAQWLAKRLERLGIQVRLVATLPDDRGQIGRFVREQAAEAAVVVVTGGLGGTPDDVTREAIADGFGVAQAEVPEIACPLRARFAHDPEYAAKWANLPVGSRPLENPLGGAPGFAFGNVYVLPGLPAEMRAMFATIEDGLRCERPIGSWRRRYRTTESRIVGVLEAMGTRHPTVRVGSYPSFDEGRSEVEVVVKSSDPAALEAAATWLEQALEDATR